MHKAERKKKERKMKKKKEKKKKEMKEKKKRTKQNSVLIKDESRIECIYDCARVDQCNYRSVNISWPYVRTCIRANVW